VELLKNGDRMILMLSREQLLLLAGSLNEAIEAVDDWEFSARLGAAKEDAYRLRSELTEVIDRLGPEA
jgi:hypothetical protein